ncbi:MAG: RHS repeat-associated core domain-containing protein [Acidobacteriota bacterium]
MTSPFPKKSTQILQAPSLKTFLNQTRPLVKASLTVVGLLTIVLVTEAKIQAQTCPNIETNGGQSISGQLKVDSTGVGVTDQAFLPRYTKLRLDSIATAFGECRTQILQGSPPSCVDNTTYNRTVNHIDIWMDVTSTGWNGQYMVGYVVGKNPNGTTAYFNVLDTQASNSSGPAYQTLMFPGTYRFSFQARMNNGVCTGLPATTEVLSLTVYVGDTDDDPNNGPTSCNANIGEPVNVTNGNVYLDQTDYRLPGFGAGLEIKRTYNSALKRDALFGYGWSSILDESIQTYGTTFLRLNWNDGRAVYFSRPTDTGVFTPQKQLDFRGQILRNGDGSYTLTLKDGSIHQFGSNGKILSISDPNGNQVALTYNGSGKVSAITDPAGRIITPTYASNGRVATLSDSTGNIATYTYDWWWSITSVTNPDGSKYNFTYDSQHRLTSVKDALNNVLESHTYDSQGRALTSEIAGNGTERNTLNYVSATQTDVTDALNHVTKYFFDKSKGRNLVTRVEGSCSCGNAQIQSWIYDSQGNISSKTDALTHTTSYTYDTSGNRLTETDGTGTVTYTYNSLGEVLTQTDQMNGVTTNTYNAQGNLLTLKDALNNTSTFTYGTRGQLITITDPRNNTTTLTYDASGNLTRRTDALNNQTNIAYDARGRATSVTNSLNQVTNYEYDLAGRPKKVIYPDTNFFLFTYDLAGRRTKIKDPRGYETTFAYDAAYRLTSETNADGKVMSYAYDLMSNLTGVTDTLNRTTNYTYDEFNRLTKIKYPEAAAGAGRLEENLTYDSAGNLLQKMDQAGRITSFCYDSSNRLTSATDPALKTTAYEYNARSQQTAVVDAINQRYEFVSDALGRRTQEKKGAATMSFVYDSAGNRTQRTDYNNAVTNYSYDALNRLTAINYPDATSATYSYDVLSRMTNATNPSGTVTIAYDNRNRVSSVTDVFGQVVSYAYDANSNRTQLSLNGVTSATYQYDVINRLTQLTDIAGLNTTLAYDPTNKLTSRTLPNGVVTTSQYDGLNRLTRLTHAKTGNTLADFQYQFDAASSITQIIDGVGAHNYTYDTRDRLTAASHPNQTNENYTLDDVGNRTASHQGSSYTTQVFNRLTAANGATFGYDANGNMTSQSDGSNSWTYTWDNENRLKQATLAGAVSVSYSYDALGRRVQRSSSVSGTTKFIYDGVDVLRDLDGSSSTIADYLNGPGIDNKLRQSVSATASYFLTDHLGTTRGTADSTGSVSASLTYDAFGNVTGGSAATRYTFTGRESDGELGLLYYRARWYDAKQGRFVSEDPFGLRAGINLYSYVKNNPTKFTDPMGENPWLIVGGILVAEALLHSYLADRAERFFPGKQDPHLRKQHCYVNCMSLRIHVGNPIWPTIVSVGIEGPSFGIEGIIRGNLRRELNESGGDLAADAFGQSAAFIIWKSCKEACEQCPF